MHVSVSITHIIRYVSKHDSDTDLQNQVWSACQNTEAHGGKGFRELDLESVDIGQVVDFSMRGVHASCVWLALILNLLLMIRAQVILTTHTRKQ